ncbi:MAG: helix-turn-helix domain-containing protein [Bacillota bacterium]
MPLQQLPHNLRYYRQKHQFTQQQLADLLKVSRSVVAKWENGHVLPDLFAAVKLSKIFQITLDTLVGEAPETTFVLSDYQAHYQDAFEDYDDVSLHQLIDFLLKNKPLQTQLELYKSLPVKQQKTIDRFLQTAIEELKKY